MTVSIVIPNWNGARLLSMCLESLLKSSYQDFEIIVVDNGSEDASCALLRERYPEVRLIQLDKNYGFAPACNEGIRAATGDWIVLLNNDIEVTPEWLQELVSGMQRHPGCRLGASRMMYRDDQDQFCNTGDGFFPWGAGKSRGEGETDCGQYDLETEVPGVCAGAAIYRRDLFDDIGLFDERFHSLAEDVDLNFRARLAGESAFYFPAAKVFHIGSATLGRYSDRYVYQAHRNEWFVMLKNLPLTQFIRHLPGILRYHFKTACYFSFRGQGKLLLKAKRDAIKQFSEMLRSRNQIQNKRTLTDPALNKLLAKSGDAL